MTQTRPWTDVPRVDPVARVAISTLSRLHHVAWRSDAIRVCDWIGAALHAIRDALPTQTWEATR